MNPQAQPPLWSEEELSADSARAISRFRETRIQEPLELYLGHFDAHRRNIEDLFEKTCCLTRLRDQSHELLTGRGYLTEIRYLTSPSVSEDDLKVLTDAKLSHSYLEKNPDATRNIIDVVLLGLDRERFPWLGENRMPTAEENTAAIVSTAALIANQKVQTARRSATKNLQEDEVAKALLASGYVEVERRSVDNFSRIPGPGEFCKESLFGGRKADLVIGLWDGRAMPTECKVSNSSTNSVKRLNNDAAVKAKVWLREFGTASCIPAAVLSGVFKVHNLLSAQKNDLTIFWSHKLETMISFIESTKN